MKRKPAAALDLAAFDYVAKLPVQDGQVRLTFNGMLGKREPELMDPIDQDEAQALALAEFFEAPGYDLLPEPFHHTLFSLAVEFGADRTNVLVTAALAELKLVRHITDTLDKDAVKAIESVDRDILFPVVMRRVDALLARL